MSHSKLLSTIIRRPTREVMVGNIGVGGNNPVRIQSMTTADTRDVEATTQQIIHLADKGCEIARVTVQGKKEAAACEHIKNSLIQKGYTIPLVADIHFYPPAAMSVIDFVDKVRINPGNFADRRATFKSLEYDNNSYQAELDRIEEKFAPLVLKCKKLNRSIRIGTNHGSLSDRIMSHYGDSPKGMVESALEFTRVCRKYDFHDIIFSMKSSNTHVMLEAYRMLVASLDELDWNYPLHLGVTEAGEGQEGRVKSSIGIGGLLLDGIGDTIRVSLTEDPWHELDPCRRLVNLAANYKAPEEKANPPFRGRGNRKAASFLHRDGSVLLQPTSKELLTENLFTLAKEESPDALFIDAPSIEPFQLKKLETLGIKVVTPCSESGIAVVDSMDSLENWDSTPSVILLRPKEDRLHFTRAFFSKLHAEKIDAPVILAFDYPGEKDDVIVQSAAEIGALLCDGMGDGILLRTDHGMRFSSTLAFNILQGSRMRSVKTEFISCPSCGRTLFDLQTVSKRIRERTAHLPGVKIAIMGCIVNGPGEMADADFGYVGSKADKIDLYVGKTCVEKNIDFSDADDRLVALIKEHGRWIEPIENLELSKKS